MKYKQIYPYYEGELGAVYTVEQTQFKLWAPTAQTVTLCVYDGYYGNMEATYSMTKDTTTGVFTYTMMGDCHAVTYRYQLTFEDGTQTSTTDPYSRASTVNGGRSVVVDLSRTNPVEWGERPTFNHALEDTIVYEMHIRDFSMHSDSGIERKGKYLGVIEKGTHNAKGDTTGLDYLCELGVTHVEILPFFDYVTVDETQEVPTTYNWGYDPLHYNVPEGSYATNPYDPFVRIRELKQMIQGLHNAGIQVIMDVVFNHVYQYEYHPFHYTVPNYYFRHNEDGTLSNGTGVGNDTASERAMMRQFIVDSVAYWASEYHIDGFRFDLMGIHDVETMNAVRQRLDQINPNIIVFGEGWDLNTPLPAPLKANSHNAPKMAGIGQFNDGLREALKGNDFEATAKGYINGAWYQEPKVLTNMLACQAYHHYLTPQQLIQYVESHDNYTLYDKLQASSPYESEATIIAQHEFATSIVLLSQGIPFIHAGQEFLRTKQGVRDSYNKMDYINQLDWTRRSDYATSVDYVRDLIAFRKAHPLFTLTDYTRIAELTQPLRADYQIVAFNLGNYLVALNGQSNVVNLEVDSGQYAIHIHNRHVAKDSPTVHEVAQTIAMQPYTVLVMERIGGTK